MDERRNVVLAIVAIAGYNLLKEKCIVKRLTHEKSSDDEYDRWNEEAIMLEERLRTRRDLRRVTRIKSYDATTIPNYTGKQFKEYFRMKKTTFENLERILTPYLIRTANSGRCTLNVHTQLLAVLWLLATLDSFRSVSDRFDISKSMLHDSMRRVVAALNNIADRFITWPKGDRLNEIKHRFSDIGSLPNVIGAIGGTHISIPAPMVDSIYYRTRKKQYAITLQAVCDANLIFTDCFVEFTGSVHDARIFRNSDFWHTVVANEQAFFPNNEFIIDDKAYPVLS
ncbi:protein ANTAGONIST OF LIKE HETEROCHROMATIN PROTEIN 1-like [Pseudomyrmex gracilis]|uniref:protein ANTAGONIST OF LIKE HETEROCHROMATIN PROTEIN 1-like n=1 Tax=Pseudomyrmex gracilis TaxID=219809 RepID=UPI00099593E5|nr:protein ANTAGONIST OF LIKE HETEROCHROMATIN PROTEIN 1-like [Pseudomyrmex gracilis]